MRGYFRRAFVRFFVVFFSMVFSVGFLCFFFVMQMMPPFKEEEWVGFGGKMRNKRGENLLRGKACMET